MDEEDDSEDTDIYQYFPDEETEYFDLDDW